MNPGSLITPAAGGLHMYESIDGNHRIFISTLQEDHLGITVESGYSNTDFGARKAVPYVRVLNADGKIGWVRYERVKVVVCEYPCTT